MNLGKIDVNNPFDLFKLLRYLEYSMETPIARLHNKKACPYCAHYEGHDPECNLKNVLHDLVMVGMYTPEDPDDSPQRMQRLGEIMSTAKELLRDLGRIDHLGNLVIYESEKIQSCPKCNRDMIKHADGEWVCHHTHVIS